MNTVEPTPQPIEVKPVRRKRSGAFWGLVLIVAGLIIFAQQTGLIGEQFNWWALFILIPAFGSFAGAFSAWQNSGKFNAAVRSGIGGGLVVLTVALIFLFGLDWSVYWPLMVIVGGFSFFLNGFETGSAAGVVSVSFWIGLGVMFLGLGFLGDYLNWFDPQSYFEPYRWWAVAILIPGIGALINSMFATIRARRFNSTAFGLFVFGLLVTATGVVALLGVSWDLLGPVLLIVLGLSVMLGIFSRRM